MKKEKIYTAPQVELLHLACEQQVFAGSGEGDTVFSNEEYNLNDVTDYIW